MRMAALVAAVLLTLTGCSVAAGEGSGEDGRSTGHYGIYEHQITLDNGRKVTCLAIESGNRGGLSCDWNNDSQPKE